MKKNLWCLFENFWGLKTANGIFAVKVTSLVTARSRNGIAGEIIRKSPVKQLGSGEKFADCRIIAVLAGERWYNLIPHDCAYKQAAYRLSKNMGILDKFKGVFGGSNRLDISKRFVLDRHAFNGTMSKFHVAKDIQTGEVFGLKLLDDEKTKHFRERFKGLNAPTEGEIGQKIEHPLVAKTIEFGFTTAGQEYILMELVNGPGVNVLIKNKMESELAPKRVGLIRKMAEALHAVHEADFIHRDICPRNFICTKGLDNVKLIDFGLSVPNKEEFRRPGNRTGTPQYMAPEVVRRRPTDERLDLFSFGVTMYRMLTFEHPWGSTDTTGVGALTHDQRPATDIRKYRPDLHDLLVDAVHKCLEIDKENRMPSTKRLLQFLKRVRSETN